MRPSRKQATAQMEFMRFAGAAYVYSMCCTGSAPTRPSTEKFSGSAFGTGARSTGRGCPRGECPLDARDFGAAEPHGRRGLWSYLLLSCCGQ